MADSDRPLRGVRVLEYSHGVAGAAAGNLLALLGAEVTLLAPGSVHPLATREPFGPGGRSLHDLFFNHGKQRQPVDPDFDLAALARDHDAVIIETDAADAQPRLEALDRPAVVITPFGLSGRHMDWRTSELVAQAAIGLVFITGDPERTPLRIGVPLAEYATGQAAASAIVMALLADDPDYRICEVSILEGSLSIMEHSFATWEYQHREWHRQGNHGRAAWGIYPCKDGYVGVISGLGEAWQAFRRLIGGPLLDDRYADIAARADHADEVHAIVLDWLADKTKQEAFALAQAGGLPFSILCDAGDVLGLDQLRARDYFDAIEADGRTLDAPGLPGKARIAQEVQA